MSDDSTPEWGPFSGTIRGFSERGFGYVQCDNGRRFALLKGGTGDPFLSATVLRTALTELNLDENLASSPNGMRVIGVHIRQETKNTPAVTRLTFPESIISAWRAAAAAVAQDPLDTGIIKNVNHAGYAFIIPANGGSDVMVLAHNTPDGVTLRPGDHVTYTKIKNGDRGWAVDGKVTVVDTTGRGLDPKILAGLLTTPTFKKVDLIVTKVRHHKITLLESGADENNEAFHVSCTLSNLDTYEVSNASPIKEGDTLKGVVIWRSPETSHLHALPREYERMLPDLQSGTVMRFCKTRGFGFIKPDADGAEVFVHMKQARQAGIVLVEGMRLSYAIKMVGGKLCAANLQRTPDDSINPDVSGIIVGRTAEKPVVAIIKRRRNKPKNNDDPR